MHIFIYPGLKLSADLSSPVSKRDPWRSCFPHSFELQLHSILILFYDMHELVNRWKFDQNNFGEIDTIYLAWYVCGQVIWTFYRCFWNLSCQRSICFAQKCKWHGGRFHIAILSRNHSTNSNKNRINRITDRITHKFYKVDRSIYFVICLITYSLYISVLGTIDFCQYRDLQSARTIPVWELVGRFSWFRNCWQVCCC